jgi:hypothetical protein
MRSGEEKADRGKNDTICLLKDPSFEELLDVFGVGLQWLETFPYATYFFGQ